MNGAGASSYRQKEAVEEDGLHPQQSKGKPKFYSPNKIDRRSWWRHLQKAAVVGCCYWAAKRAEPPVMESRAATSSFCFLHVFVLILPLVLLVFKSAVATKGR